MVRTKICGISSAEDVAVATVCGADAVGFLCGLTHYSEDELSADEARELAGLVPPYINRVLVTHLTEPEAILELAESLPIDTIQLHGSITDEAAELVRECWLGAIVRVIHIDDQGAVERARAAADCGDALLLDSRDEGRLGGTGKTHDWSISAKIVAEMAARGLPCILAGGLSPANLRQAIAQVKPFAVDVNSGVDDEEGDKDQELVRAFIGLAHQD